jgi:hypothetical protein
MYRRFGFHWRRNRLQFGGAAPGQPEPGSFNLRRLVICPECGSDYVAVIDGQECDDGEHWAVTLRCGGCEVPRSVVASSHELDRFLDDLEWDALQLEGDAEQLWRERTSEEIEIFVWALERDLIGTDDFER